MDYSIMIDKNLAAYKIPYGMYIAIGGDPNREFTSIADIYTEINKIYASRGNRVDIDPLKVDLITNGTYMFNEDDITGYKPVEVNVNVDVDDVYNEGYSTGYTKGLDDGAKDQKGKLESISITENGTYNREDGYNEVKVNVQGRLELPFEEIGYPSELKNELNNKLNSKPLSDLEYSKSIYDEWKPSTSYASSKYNGNKKIVYCPLIDTSNVINMNYMFKNCSSLTTMPLLNTSKVTNMGSTFLGCSSLTSIPQFNTSNVTTMSSIFDGCSSLTSISLLNTSKVTNMNYAIGFSILSKLTDLGGFKNLGAQPTLSGTNDNYFLYNAPNITHNSAMNIINNLYDRKSAGYSVITLKFATKTLALLSEDEISIATNKGWIIS